MNITFSCWCTDLINLGLIDSTKKHDGFHKFIENQNLEDAACEYVNQLVADNIHIENTLNIAVKDESGYIHQLSFDGEVIKNVNLINNIGKQHLKSA